MKRIIILLTMLFAGLGVYAQNDAMLTQQWFSRINRNPAATGNTNDVDIFMLHRKQWNGFKDAPRTSLLNVQNYFEKINSGVGLSMSYDKEGAALKNYNAKAVYAYHIPLSGRAILSLGLGGGVQRKELDETQLTPVHPGDPSLTGKETKTNIDFDFGGEFALPRLTLGASMTHLGRTDKDKLTSFKNGQQIYVYGRYRITLIDALDLAPTISYVHGNSSDLWEFGGTLFIVKKFWIGGSWRKDVAACVMAGCEFGMFRVGYSYDHYLGDTKRLGSGTHEVMLSVRIPKSKRSHRFVNE